MAERPILFSGPMVRALLAGTKTQTRRVVSKQATHDLYYQRMYGVSPPPNPVAFGTPGLWRIVGPDYPDGKDDDVTCPYGQPGDRLWVREAFMHEPADYCWEASVSIPSRPASTVYRADYPESQPGEGWKPSIHMPRNLCRLVLEVTAVRVERLQAITEADAQAEGVERDGESFWRGYAKGHYDLFPDARGSYASLWVSINGEGSWDANPWVWAVSFRRVQP